MPPYWLIRNLWVRMGHFQNHSFAALVCLDLFSYHDVFSSPPSTLIYRRGGVSSILTQRVPTEKKEFGQLILAVQIVESTQVLWLNSLLLLKYYLRLYSLKLYVYSMP